MVPGRKHYVNNVTMSNTVFFRLINEHVDPPAVKLTHLQKAVSKLKPNVLLGVFDLRSCYFQ